MVIKFFYNTYLSFNAVWRIISNPFQSIVSVFISVAILKNNFKKLKIIKTDCSQKQIISRRGTVVWWLRPKTHDRKVVGSNPTTADTIYLVPFIWTKNKLPLYWTEKITWHCCMCCIPANGRVDIEEVLAYKTQLHGGNE